MLSDISRYYRGSFFGIHGGSLLGISSEGKNGSATGGRIDFYPSTIGGPRYSRRLRTFHENTPNTKQFTTKYF